MTTSLITILFNVEVLSLYDTNGDGLREAGRGLPKGRVLIVGTLIVLSLSLMTFVTTFHDTIVKKRKTAAQSASSVNGREVRDREGRSSFGDFRVLERIVSPNEMKTESKRNDVEDNESVARSDQDDGDESTTDTKRLIAEMIRQRIPDLASRSEDMSNVVIGNGLGSGTFTATFYTPNCQGCTGITASGNPARPGVTIAVDPRYWRMGTVFYVEGLGVVVAEDTGGGIRGRDRIDVCVATTHEAITLGVKCLRYWVLYEPSR